MTTRSPERERSTSVNSPSSADRSSGSASSSATIGRPSGVSSRKGLSSPASAAFAATATPAVSAAGRTISGPSPGCGSRGISVPAATSRKTSAARRSSSERSDAPPAAGCPDGTPACTRIGRRIAGVSASAAGAAGSPSSPECRPAARTSSSGAAFAPASGAAAPGAGASSCSPPPSGSSAVWPTTLRRTVSTIRSLRSTMTLPASLTVLMKLRLMNTPVRIHPPSSRMSVPTTPMWAWSISETPMPKAPPQPVEEQRLQRSPKAKPRVSDPRMRISSSERIEWLRSSGRWRMMRMPTSTSMQGSRMPKTPNELSTSMRPMRAPASPQRFSTSSPNSSRSSAGRCRMLWST